MTRSLAALLALGLALALLPSCRHTLQSGLRLPDSLEQAPQVTTLDEVHAAFGLPDKFVYGDDGQRTLVYTYTLSLGEGARLGRMIKLVWVHMQRGVDRLEITVDAHGKVLDQKLFLQTGEIEPRLNPF